MVEEEWRNLGSMDLVDKLSKIITPIKGWNKEVFGCIDHRINILELEVIEIERNMDENGLNECQKWD